MLGEELVADLVAALSRREAGGGGGAVGVEPIAHGVDGCDLFLRREGFPAADKVDGLVEAGQLGSMVLEVPLVGEEGGVQELDQGVQLEGVELHGGGGEHQEAQAPPLVRVCESLGEAVELGGAVPALTLAGPPGVVGLVDDHEVPAGERDVGLALLVPGGVAGGDDDVVAQGPDVVAGTLGVQEGRGGAVVVREDLVELGPQLVLPLADDAGRGEDEDAVGHAAGLELLDDQARLDGLAEADLVREDEAVRVRGGRAVHDADLVLLDLHARVRQRREAVELVGEQEAGGRDAQVGGPGEAEVTAPQQRDGVRHEGRPEPGLGDGLERATREGDLVDHDALR